jgi:DNA-binding response OmpR family regulator
MEECIIVKNLNLLFVDDNSQVAADAYSKLSPIFKSVTLAHDYQAAIGALQLGEIDILITDIFLKDRLGGLELIKAVRQFDHQLPIIVLSANTEMDNLVAAVNQQIDGFLTKPFELDQLQARLSNIIRRLDSRYSQIKISNNLLYDFAQKRLHVDEEPIKLGQKERTLLELLLVNQNKSVSKSQIRKRIWPDEVMTESAIKSLFAELRKKLKYNVIINIPALGWMIQTEFKEDA